MDFKIEFKQSHWKNPRVGISNPKPKKESPIRTQPQPEPIIIIITHVKKHPSASEVHEAVAS
jgi:hypothetical protein